MASPDTNVFSKTLSKTDAKKRLAIPTRSMGSLPSFNGSHAIRIVLISGTQTWPIQYTISKNGTNKRPSFTSGWTQFVACNGLKCGDELSLFKEGSFLYRVEVEEKPVDASGSNQQVLSCVTFPQKAKTREKPSSFSSGLAADGGEAAEMRWFATEIDKGKPPCMAKEEREAKLFGHLV